MALHVWSPGDFREDHGEQRKVYPIPEKVDPYSDILYDKYIQKTSYIQANIVGVFNDWIQSFFAPDYFKFVRIRTQSAYTEFKSFMKQIYKKEKPFMLIDPRSIDHVEDSLFGQNMVNRYNVIDPEHDTTGAKLLYSIQIMKDDMFELVYRRNRYRFEFDVMIMEQTMDRQIDTYNNMLMNIRHNSKFLLRRTIPFMIPGRYIQNIAKLHNYDWKSDEFLTFMNSISQFPITRRIVPGSETYMFFMQQEMNIQVETPGYPSKDTPEMSDAFEWGARIVDNFVMIADLPTEFLLLLPAEFMPKYDKGIPEDPEKVYCISPIYADMDWPKEYGDFKQVQTIDVMLQTEEDDNTMDMIKVVTDGEAKYGDMLREHLARGGDLKDLLLVKAYQNGMVTETNYAVDEKGILTLRNPIVGKLYTILVYLNFKLFNFIQEGKAKQYIGTIEKY